MSLFQRRSRWRRQPSYPIDAGIFACMGRGNGWLNCARFMSHIEELYHNVSGGVGGFWSRICVPSTVLKWIAYSSLEVSMGESMDVHTLAFDADELKSFGICIQEIGCLMCLEPSSENNYGISISSARRWRNNGTITTVETSGGHFRYLLDGIVNIRSNIK